MTATPHSLKGLKTLELMNADPLSWKPCPSRAEWRIMPVPTEVKCEACEGTGRLDAEGKPTHFGGREGVTACPECLNPRSRYGYSRGTGIVTKNVMREVLVYVLDWPKGTKFPSRFGDADRLCCELCGKSISPVSVAAMLGKNKDGEWIGLWPGIDCAGKLWDVSESKDLRLVSKESAIMYRDTNRATEEDKARREAAKTAREAAKIARETSGLMLTNRPEPGNRRLGTPSETDEIAREVLGDLYDSFSSFDNTEKTWSGTIFVGKRGGDDHHIEHYDFRVSEKFGAACGTFYRATGDKKRSVYKDKDTRDVKAALRAALEAIKADWVKNK